MKLLSTAVHGFNLLQKARYQHIFRHSRNLLAVNTPSSRFSTAMAMSATPEPQMPTTSGSYVEPDMVQKLKESQMVSSILPPITEGSRRIYLLRHGETDWNKIGKIQGGGFDIPLNANGKEQALCAAMALDDIPVSVIVSSHLSRAKETANYIWERQLDTAGNNRDMDPGLGEMRFGDFEGLAWRDPTSDKNIVKRFKEFSRTVEEEYDFAFPNGESTKDVQERSTRALQGVLDEYPDEEHIAVVSHGRTNRILIASIAMGDALESSQVKQGNTCINVLDVDREGKWTVQTLNFIEHVRDIVILR